MRNILFILILIFCSKVALGESIIFDYDDFGPQVLAYKTIGFQWYQWNSSGSSDPNEIDDIKVVVYWDEPIEKIKERFPIDPKKKHDYRYLSYESAIRYLDSALIELPNEMNLTNTKNKLLKIKEK